MVTHRTVIKHKIGLLRLAQELGNVSRACKVMGYSRDTFYRYQQAVEEGGVEALMEKSRRKPNLRNRTAPEIEEAIIRLAFEQPAFGQVRVMSTVIQISPGVVIEERGGALAHDVAKGNGVDGNRGFGHRARLRAAADDDHLLFELHRQDDVDGYGNPGVEHHAAARVLLEAGQHERHVIQPRQESGDRERADAIGDGRFDRAAGLGAARLHGHAG